MIFCLQEPLPFEGETTYTAEFQAKAADLPAATLQGTSNVTMPKVPFEGQSSYSADYAALTGTQLVMPAKDAAAARRMVRCRLRTRILHL